MGPWFPRPTPGLKGIDLPDVVGCDVRSLSALPWRQLPESPTGPRDTGVWPKVGIKDLGLEGMYANIVKWKFTGTFF